MSDLSSTLYGCPESSLLALNSACPLAAAPTCVTKTLDDSCCGSAVSFIESLATCYSVHAPSCLDVSAIASAGSAQLAAQATDTTICSHYFATATDFGLPGTAGTAAATATGGSGTAAPASSAAPASATPTANVGSSVQPAFGSLKVALGVVLMGVLTVLAM